MILRLAAQQWGVVARGQLLGEGVRPDAINGRLERGTLIRVARGVYAVGHVPRTREGRWMVGVLSGGPGTFLSHRSAAALWQLLSGAQPVEVTTGRRMHRVPELTRHYAKLPADETTTHHGIPVTTVPRTLFDLAAVIDRSRLERTIHEAEVQRLHDPLSLHDLLARHPHQRGARNLRAILAAGELGLDVTKDELERLFLAFLDARGLPRPLINRPLQLGNRWIRPDCMWPHARLIAELDGRASHGPTRAFESDRLRDRRAVVGGWRVIRITWRQLKEDPDELEADLRALL